MSEQPERERIENVEWVEIGQLVPAPWNPRQITVEQKRALQRSLREFGAVDPAVVRREDGLILGGHQRVDAAREMGWTQFPVVYVSGIDDVRAKALNIALNRISGEWDNDRLAILLDELRDSDLDEHLTGFSDAEIDTLLRRAEQEAPDGFGEVNPQPNVTCPRCSYQWHIGG